MCHLEAAGAAALKRRRDEELPRLAPPRPAVVQARVAEAAGRLHAGASFGGVGHEHDRRAGKRHGRDCPERERPAGALPLPRRQAPRAEPGGNERGDRAPGHDEDSEPGAGGDPFGVRLAVLHEAGSGEGPGGDGNGRNGRGKRQQCPLDPVAREDEPERDGDDRAEQPGPGHREERGHDGGIGQHDPDEASRASDRSRREPRARARAARWRRARARSSSRSDRAAAQHGRRRGRAPGSPCPRAPRARRPRANLRARARPAGARAGRSSRQRPRAPRRPRTRDLGSAPPRIDPARPTTRSRSRSTSPVRRARPRAARRRSRAGADPGNGERARRSPRAAPQRRPRTSRRRRAPPRGARRGRARPPSRAPRSAAPSGAPRIGDQATTARWTLLPRILVRLQTVYSSLIPPSSTSGRLCILEQPERAAEAPSR